MASLPNSWSGGGFGLGGLGGSVRWDWAALKAAEIMKPSFTVQDPLQPPLPAVESPDGPVRVLKLAGLVLRPGGVRYWGVGLNDPTVSYGPDATAECHRHQHGYQYTYEVPPAERATGTKWLPDHRSPHDYCTCGFYIAKHHHQWPMTLDSWWRIEAEVFGDFVDHGRGQRWERQRVLAVRVPPFCHLCQNEGTVEGPPTMAYMNWQPAQLPSGSMFRAAFEYQYNRQGVVAVWAAHTECVTRTLAGGPGRVDPLSFPELRRRLAPVALQVPG